MSGVRTENFRDTADDSPRSELRTGLEAAADRGENSRAEDERNWG